MSFEARNPRGLTADVFFIVSLLSSCRFASADDSNSIQGAFRETPQQHTVENRIAHNNFALLAIGMVFFWKDRCPRIIEDRTPFIETDAMLSLVAFGFARIPFKHQRHITLPFLRFHLEELRHVAELLVAAFKQVANRQLLDRGQML